MEHTYTLTVGTPAANATRFIVLPSLSTPVRLSIPERDPDQAWYWTPAWQAGEREAEADLAAGRYQDFRDIDDLLAAL